MSNLMSGLEFVRTYLDDVLVLTTSTWDDHLRKLDVVLHCIAKAGLKVNASKSSFGIPEIKYLVAGLPAVVSNPLQKRSRQSTQLPLQLLGNNYVGSLVLSTTTVTCGSAEATCSPHLRHSALRPSSGVGQMWNKRLLI